MAATTFFKANDWIRTLIEDANLDTDVFRIALSNTAPTSESNNPLLSGNGVIANVTQISYANYSDTLPTDRRLNNTGAVSSGGIYTFTADNFTITANGGTIADFRYLYIYNDTLTGDPIVGVWDYGEAISLAINDSLVVSVAATGIFSVS
jgi:hypothetical protein